MDNKPNGKGVGRIIKATQCSIQGFKAVYTHESAFRQELLLALILLPLSIVVAQTPIQFALLNGVLLIVLLVEIINSAIEAVVDRISLEHHELSGRAKDLGSSAVFIALSLCVLVWSAILFNNYVFQLE